MSDPSQRDSDHSDSVWDNMDAHRHSRHSSDSTVTPFPGEVGDQTDHQPQDSSVQTTVSVQPPNEFSTLLDPNSISREPSPTGLDYYPDYGLEEAHDQRSPQSYDDSIPSPVSVLSISPHEPSFLGPKFDVVGLFVAPPAMSRDSSGSTGSYTTALGEQDQTSVPYPMTPRTVDTGTHHDHDYRGKQPAPSFRPASPPASYYDTGGLPGYISPLSQYDIRPGSSQAIIARSLFGFRLPVPKAEPFESDLASSYPSYIWQQPHTLETLQGNDNNSSRVDAPFSGDSARIPSTSSPRVDFGAQIKISGSIRMPSSYQNTDPVPTPNLTEESRGWPDPTKLSTISLPGVGKSARMFSCTVDRCGKSFNRDEHLQYHIRSIHTDEELPPAKQLRLSAPSVESVRSSEMTSSKMFECLIEHGCLDLRSSIDPNRFSSCRVAEGGFGDVWKGQLTDGTDVALKVLRYGLVREDGSKSIKRAMREIYNWSKLEHKNVHRLLGITMFQERLGMVSKWMEHGTLQQYLNQDGNVNRHPLCLQMAEGVAYLHNVNMIHGDLKACNVLVSSDGVLKLTDFDYSIISDCSLVFSATTRMGGGTLRWMAPELVVDDEPTERNKKTDIYALGMTFLETITNALPYSECRRDAQIYGKLSRREHPRRSIEHFPNTSQSSNPMWDLLVRCWDYDPASRPTASQVLSILHTFD